MGRKRAPGLQMRGGVWHIDKIIGRKRVNQSTGTSDLEEAEKFLAHKMETIRQAQVYGVRPDRTFEEAAVKYVQEEDKRSLRSEIVALRPVVRMIGDIPLKSVNMGVMQPYIDHLREAGRKNRTINYGLQVVRHILNLAANEWIDENGLSWIEHAPKIKLLRMDDASKPYPLTWAEQERLFAELPEHLRRMALFKVNTGCREREVYGLKWEYEIEVPSMNTSVFLIPAHRVKNKEDRLVVLNRVAAGVIEEVRGTHP